MTTQTSTGNRVDTLTRAARIATMPTAAISHWIDRLLDMRLDGANPNWCDPELADLRAEQKRRGV